MKIRELDARAAPAWDRFVRESPESTFFHWSAWPDVLRRAFGHRDRSVYAEQDGEIIGVLPLVHVKSRLFTNALISAPFCTYGGVVAREENARRALEDAAVACARKTGVDYVEMRNRARTRRDWPEKTLYVTFRKTLAPDVDENFRAIPRKQRAVVRKGIQGGLASAIDTDVDRLYRAYAESVRNLGTPVFAKRYLKLLKQAFGDDCEVLTVTDAESRLVASVMSFYFKDEILPYYGGGVAAARELKGNDFMYWEVMRRACERGVRVFDYGRSKRDTGAYRFKTHWGFEPSDLHYEYALVNADEMPDLSPANPRYERAIEAWKKLPLPVANRLGPWLAGSLG